jgi:hypothetical protein
LHPEPTKKINQPTENQDLQTTQHPYLFNAISIHAARFLTKSGQRIFKIRDCSGDLQQSRKELRVGSWRRVWRRTLCTHNIQIPALCALVSE